MLLPEAGMFHSPETGIILLLGTIMLYQQEGKNMLSHNAFPFLFAYSSSREGTMCSPRDRFIGSRDQLIQLSESVPNLISCRKSVECTTACDVLLYSCKFLLRAANQFF